MPRASFATRTRPTTGDPDYEEGLQAAALEAKLADERNPANRTSPGVLR